MKIDERFGFEIPTSCPEVPSDILFPSNTWENKSAFETTKAKLVDLFKENFKQFEGGVNAEILNAGPK